MGLFSHIFGHHHSHAPVDSSLPASDPLPPPPAFQPPLENTSLPSAFSMTPSMVNRPRMPTHQQATDTARNAIIAGAQTYMPPLPPLTLKDAYTEALAPFIDQAKQKADAAKVKMDAANADVQATQDGLDRLARDQTVGLDLPVAPGLTHRQQQRQTLQTRLTQQQTTAGQARQEYDAANAQVVAGNTMLYAHQAQTAQKTAVASMGGLNKAYGALKNALPANAANGVAVPEQGAYLSPDQVSALTPDQQVAYGNYINAQYQADNDLSRYKAVIAVHDQSYAQLQVYQSDQAQYGPVAANAVAAVNQIVPSSRLLLPPAIDPAVARQNLDSTSRAVNYLDAMFDATSARLNVGQVAAQGAADVAAAQKSVSDFENVHLVDLADNAPLKVALQQATDKAGKANTQAMADFNTKSAYVAKLQLEGGENGDQGIPAAQVAVDQAQQDVAGFQAAHPNVPLEGNPFKDALANANHDLGMLQQQLDVANSGFTAAYGQSYALQLDQQADLAHQATLTKVPLQQGALDKLTGAWNSAKTTADGAHSAADLLSAEAAKKDADLTVAQLQGTPETRRTAVTTAQAKFDQWNIANPGVPALNPYASELAVANQALAVGENAMTQQKVAQFDLLKTQFHENLPDNLRNLDSNSSESDQKAYAKAENAFYKQYGQDIAGTIIQEQQRMFNDGQPIRWDASGSAGTINSDGQFRNIVGQAIGADATPADPAGAQIDSGDQFSGNAAVDKVQGVLREVGGDQPQFSVETEVYTSPQTGMRTVNLFHVQSKDTGKDVFVDTEGQTYSSKSDFLKHNDLSTSGQLFSADGKNEDGTLNITSTKAHHNTVGQSIEKFGPIKWVEDHSTVGFALSIGLDIFAPIVAATGVGAPLAVGMVIAGDVLATSVMTAGAVNGAARMSDMADHGGIGALNPINGDGTSRLFHGHMANPFNMEPLNTELTTVAMGGGVIAKGLEKTTSVFTKGYEAGTAMNPMAGMGTRLGTLPEKWNANLATAAKVNNLSTLTAFGTQTGLAFTQAGVEAYNHNGDMAIDILKGQAINILYMGHQPLKTSLVRAVNTGHVTISGESAGFGNKARLLKYDHPNDPAIGRRLSIAEEGKPINPVSIDGKPLYVREDGSMTVDGRPLQVNGKTITLDGDTLTFGKEQVVKSNGDPATRLGRPVTADTAYLLGEKITIGADGTLRLGDKITLGADGKPQVGESVTLSENGELMIGSEPLGASTPRAVDIAAGTSGNARNGLGDTPPVNAAQAVDRIDATFTSNHPANTVNIAGKISADEELAMQHDSSVRRDRQDDEIRQVEKKQGIKQEEREKTQKKATENRTARSTEEVGVSTHIDASGNREKANGIRGANTVEENPTANGEPIATPGPKTMTQAAGPLEEAIVPSTDGVSAGEQKASTIARPADDDMAVAGRQEKASLVPYLPHAGKTGVYASVTPEQLAYLREPRNASGGDGKAPSFIPLDKAIRTGAQEMTLEQFAAHSPYVKTMLENITQPSLSSASTLTKKQAIDPAARTQDAAAIAQPQIGHASGMHPDVKQSALQRIRTGDPEPRQATRTTYQVSIKGLDTVHQVTVEEQSAGAVKFLHTDPNGKTVEISKSKLQHRHGASLSNEELAARLVSRKEGAATIVDIDTKVVPSSGKDAHSLERAEADQVLASSVTLSSGGNQKLNQFTSQAFESGAQHVVDTQAFALPEESSPPAVSQVSQVEDVQVIEPRTTDEAGRKQSTKPSDANTRKPGSASYHAASELDPNARTTSIRTSHGNAEVKGGNSASANEAANPGEDIPMPESGSSGNVTAAAPESTDVEAAHAEVKEARTNSHDVVEEKNTGRAAGSAQKSAEVDTPVSAFGTEHLDAQQQIIDDAIGRHDFDAAEEANKAFNGHPQQAINASAIERGRSEHAASHEPETRYQVVHEGGASSGRFFEDAQHAHLIAASTGGKVIPVQVERGTAHDPVSNDDAHATKRKPVSEPVNFSEEKTSDTLESKGNDEAMEGAIASPSITTNAKHNEYVAEDSPFMRQQTETEFVKLLDELLAAPQTDKAALEQDAKFINDTLEGKEPKASTPRLSKLGEAIKRMPPEQRAAMAAKAEFTVDYVKADQLTGKQATGIVNGKGEESTHTGAANPGTGTMPGQSVSKGEEKLPVETAPAQETTASTSASDDAGDLSAARNELNASPDELSEYSPATHHAVTQQTTPVKKAAESASEMEEIPSMVQTESPMHALEVQDVPTSFEQPATMYQRISLEKWEQVEDAGERIHVSSKIATNKDAEQLEANMRGELIIEFKPEAYQEAHADTSRRAWNLDDIAVVTNSAGEVIYRAPDHSTQRHSSEHQADDGSAHGLHERSESAVSATAENRETGINQAATRESGKETIEIRDHATGEVHRVVVKENHQGEVVFRHIGPDGKTQGRASHAELTEKWGPGLRVEELAHKFVAGESDHMDVVRRNAPMDGKEADEKNVDSNAQMVNPLARAANLQPADPSSSELPGARTASTSEEALVSSLIEAGVSDQSHETTAQSMETPAQDQATRQPTANPRKQAGAGSNDGVEYVPLHAVPPDARKTQLKAGLNEESSIAEGGQVSPVDDSTGHSSDDATQEKAKAGLQEDQENIGAVAEEITESAAESESHGASAAGASETMPSPEVDMHARIADPDAVYIAVTPETAQRLLAGEDLGMTGRSGTYDEMRLAASLDGHMLVELKADVAATGVPDEALNLGDIARILDVHDDPIYTAPPLRRPDALEAHRIEVPGKEGYEVLFTEELAQDLMARNYRFDTTRLLLIGPAGERISLADHEGFLQGTGRKLPAGHIHRDGEAITPAWARFSIDAETGAYVTEVGLVDFKEPMESRAAALDAESLHRAQHRLAIKTRRLSAQGMEEVLNNPSAVEEILERYGQEYSAYLQDHLPEGFPGDPAVMALKFRKGIANGAVQHMTLLQTLVEILRNPQRVANMLRTSYERQEGDYFAFQLDGPGGRNGFEFFPDYADARHNFMAAAVRLFASAHENAIASSPEWQKVEGIKAALTSETREQGLRKAYRTQPEPNWPPTVWSLSQNVNSALVPIRAVLAALDEAPQATESSWADVQRQFFERPRDLKAMAGVTAWTLGEYTQPNGLPGVEVVKDASSQDIQRFKWKHVTDSRLRDDPGGICFGFSGIHEQARTSAQEAEIRAIMGLVGIKLPSRFSAVEMLTMVGAFLMPHLGDDHLELHLEPRTLTDELMEAHQAMGRERNAGDEHGDQGASQRDMLHQTELVSVELDDVPDITDAFHSPMRLKGVDFDASMASIERDLRGILEDALAHQEQCKELYASLGTSHSSDSVPDQPAVANDDGFDRLNREQFLEKPQKAIDTIKAHLQRMEQVRQAVADLEQSTDDAALSRAARDALADFYEHAAEVRKGIHSPLIKEQILRQTTDFILGRENSEAAIRSLTAWPYYQDVVGQLRPERQSDIGFLAENEDLVDRLLIDDGKRKRLQVSQSDQADWLDRVAQAARLEMEKITADRSVLSGLTKFEADQVDHPAGAWLSRQPWSKVSIDGRDFYVVCDSLLGPSPMQSPLPGARDSHGLVYLALDATTRSNGKHLALIFGDLNIGLLKNWGFGEGTAVADGFSLPRKGMTFRVDTGVVEAMRGRNVPDDMVEILTVPEVDDPVSSPAPSFPEVVQQEALAEAVETTPSIPRGDTSAAPVEVDGKRSSLVQGIAGRVTRLKKIAQGPKDERGAISLELVTGPASFIIDKVRGKRSEDAAAERAPRRRGGRVDHSVTMGEGGHWTADGAWHPDTERASLGDTLSQLHALEEDAAARQHRETMDKRIASNTLTRLLSEYDGIDHAMELLEADRIGFTKAAKEYDDNLYGDMRRPRDSERAAEIRTKLGGFPPNLQNLLVHYSKCIRELDKVQDHWPELIDELDGRQTDIDYQNIRDAFYGAGLKVGEVQAELLAIKPSRLEAAREPEAVSILRGDAQRERGHSLNRWLQIAVERTTESHGEEGAFYPRAFVDPIANQLRKLKGWKQGTQSEGDGPDASVDKTDLEQGSASEEKYYVEDDGVYTIDADGGKSYVPESAFGMRDNDVGPEIFPEFPADSSAKPEGRRGSYTRGQKFSMRVVSLGRKDPGSLLENLRRMHGARGWKVASGEFQPSAQVNELIDGIPGGLEDWVADIHAHPYGYDFREEMDFLTLQEKASPNAFILNGSIPQYCGSGDGHYSAANAGKLTLNNKLDMDRKTGARVKRIWSDYKAAHGAGDATEADRLLRQLARADISFTDIDPAQNRTTPDDVETAFLDNPGVPISVGEWTGDKEMVRNMFPERDRFSFGDEGSRAVLEKLDEIGMFAQQQGNDGRGPIVLVHNDWGLAENSGYDGRPEPTRQAYEHFDRLIDVVADYPHANIILAHTGLGRFVGPDSALRHEVHIPARDDRPAEILRDVPEHVARLYDAVYGNAERGLAGAPNILFDISWNDVSKAYLTSGPEMRNGLVDFIVRNQDRILWGSDTVKPVNQAQYNQSLYTAAPLIVDVAKINPEAAWKMGRGNYERVARTSRIGVTEWTADRLRTRGTPEADEQVRDMFEMVEVREQMREQISADARLRFEQWVKLLGDQSGTRTGMHARPLSEYEKAYQALPEAKDLLAEQHGHHHMREGTPHGNRNGFWRNLAAGGVLTVFSGAALAATEGTSLALGRAGALFGAVNALAFITRAGLLYGKTAYVDGVRLKWEQMFEEGQVDNQIINQYANRLNKWSCAFGVAPDRMMRIARITEQFRQDIAQVMNTPVERFRTVLIDPDMSPSDPGYQKMIAESQAKQKFNIAMQVIGQYQISVNANLGVQDSSINAMDARTWTGQLYRGMTAATYMVNVASAGHFFANGIHVTDVGPFFQTAFQGLFGTANTLLLTSTLAGMASGVMKLSPSWETRAPFKFILPASMTEFAAASVPWAMSDLADIPNHASLMMQHPVIGAVPVTLDMAKAGLDILFGWRSWQITRTEIARAFQRSMPKPAKVAMPYLGENNVGLGGSARRIPLIGFAGLASVLAAREVLQLLPFLLPNFGGPGTAGVSGTSPVTQPQPSILPTQPSTQASQQPNARQPNPQQAGTQLPGQQQPALPPVQPKIYAVRSGDNLWNIARKNEDTLLSDQEKQLAKTMSQNEVIQMALNDLMAINHFSPNLQDGIASHLPGDPDMIHSGQEIVVTR